MARPVALLHAPPDTKDGDVWKWSFDIQRELPWQSAISIGYAGSKGTNIGNSVINYNDPRILSASFVQANRPYPQFYDPALPNLGVQGTGRIRYIDSFGEAFYHGMQVKYDKRSRSGLTLGVAYTYSKTHGDGDNGGQEGANYQNPLDRRQKLVHISEVRAAARPVPVAQERADDEPEEPRQRTGPIPIRQPRLPEDDQFKAAFELLRLLYQAHAANTDAPFIHTRTIPGVRHSCPTVDVWHHPDQRTRAAVQTPPWGATAVAAAQRSGAGTAVADEHSGRHEACRHQAGKPTGALPCVPSAQPPSCSRSPLVPRRADSPRARRRTVTRPPSRVPPHPR